MRLMSRTSSDADSDVLADYVLALLRHDHTENEVKQLCIEQLDDFLKDRQLSSFLVVCGCLKKVLTQSTKQILDISSRMFSPRSRLRRSVPSIRHSLVAVSPSISLHATTLLPWPTK